MSAQHAALSDADAALLDAFCDQLWLEDGLAKNTLEAYRRDLRLLGEWLAGAGRGLLEASEVDLLGYLAARHEAGDVLLKAGPSAIPFLREASESDSPEIRFRATEILQRIELQVLSAQKADILSGAMTQGQLPAWDRYLQIVDDSSAARRLFVAMLERGETIYPQKQPLNG